MDNLTISVVTPSLNQARFLRKNIISVLSQKYTQFEHIVADGGSTDGSIDILASYPHLKWFSEKDSGQAQAINNALKKVRGDIVGWLNSDDVYCQATFGKVSAIFRSDKYLDFIFSNCLHIDQDDRIIGFQAGKDPEIYPVLFHRNYIPQPTVFFRRRVLDITGYLDERYQMSMDFDYWRRISKSHKMKFVNDIFACFRQHVLSKTHTNTAKFKAESRVSFFENGGTVFSPYYFETFIRPKLTALFINNILFRRIFYKKSRDRSPNSSI
jgi:glycosyltransferase involved in cell wall biosynthesis